MGIIKTYMQKIKIKKSNIENNFSDDAIQNNANEIHQTFLMDPRLLVERYIELGDYDSVIRVMKDVAESLQQLHPLSPHYIFDVRKLGDKTFLTSKPTNLKTTIKNDITYKTKFTIQDKKFKAEFGLDRYLYQQFIKEQPIEINIVSLEEMIGDTIIENPLSISTILEKNAPASMMLVNTKRPNIKCKIRVREKGIYKDAIGYLEMQLTNYEIEKNVFTLSNSNQKISYLEIQYIISLENVTVDKDMIKVDKVEYDIKLKQEYSQTVAGELVLLEFMNILQSSEEIQLCDIERNKMVFEARVNKIELENIIDYTAPIATLKMLRQLEEQYDVHFKLVEEIDKENQQLLNLLESALQDKEIEFDFKELNIKIEDKEQLENIAEIIGTRQALDIKSESIISGALFGVELELVCEEQYNMLMFKDLECIEEKLKLFEDGELIQITLVQIKKSKATKKVKLLNVSHMTQ